jgi:hypothetical protein
LEEDVPQRVAPAVFRTLQRREFPREQTVRFLLRRYSKYAEHHVFSKLLCGKSSSICKSRAKAHPDGHHFEIIRV